MAFEYDQAKSDSNKRKHGIDFEEATALWHDPEIVVISAKETDEQRSLVIGMINGKHWSAVITQRIDNIRLISVRRSRKEEVEIYESIGV